MYVLSGQRLVTTAGTAVALTTGSGISGAGSFLIKALPGNSGTVYIGNDASDDVTSSNGMPLAAGELIRITVSDLVKVYMDATTSSQGVAWFRDAGEAVGIDAPSV